jgi:hypothetical protein
MGRSSCGSGPRRRRSRGLGARGSVARVSGRHRRCARPAGGGASEFPKQRVARRRRDRDGDHTSWEGRWQAALSAGDGTFEIDGFAERTLPDDLGAWSEPARGAPDRLRACFRLELPGANSELFTLRFQLQSPDDPSLLVTALDPEAAWALLNEGARALADAGFGVIVPVELTVAGRRRLRLRMRVSGGGGVVGAVAGAAGLGLEELLAFEWEAALGDETLTALELRALAMHRPPSCSVP